jgi:hypothetical protein
MVALLVLPAAAAGTSNYSRVLRAYQNRGSIPPCQFSSAELQSALKSVDTYGAQYFADFTAAIQTALSARATGVCTGGGTAAIAPSSGVGSPAASPASRLPVTASSGANLPAPIVLLGALAALFASIAAAVGVARARGWDPPWMARWRHAWAEAGYRVGDTWAEFSDWLRSGDR